MQKYTKLFTKTKRQAPKDETSINAKLLIQAGYIHKEMAGVYSFLPLGLRVLDKISNIVREEMNKIGGLELKLTTLQEKTLWEKTNRWSDETVDIWFKSNLKAGGEIGLGLTHEEPLTNIVSQHINSYKDLPVYLYQIQTKFRNEIRAKSGIMRGREFLMKDLYSFNHDQQGLDSFYELAKKAYTEVYNRTGIGQNTFITFASGGIFSKYSHEFQALSEAGEDHIYIDKEKGIAINEEVYTEDVINELGLDKSKLEKVKAIEVGNIFKLGTKFSEPLGLNYTDKDGNTKPVIMGCYGIGVSRLMGTIVEIHNDEKGIIWPKSVAPYHIHLITLGEQHHKQASETSAKLEAAGYEILWDDREDIGAGEKFADADLIGIPVRLVLSDRSIQNGGLELKERNKKESEIINIDNIQAKIKEIYS